MGKRVPAHVWFHVCHGHVDALVGRAIRLPERDAFLEHARALLDPESIHWRVDVEARRDGSERELTRISLAIPRSKFDYAAFFARRTTKA